MHEPDLEQASIHCRVAPNGSDHGGYYVIGICSGYVNYENGTHADLGVLPVLYFVRPDLTVRVSDLDSRYFDCTDVFAAENSSQNFAGVCEGSTASYLVYNLRPERQTVDVAVGFLGSDGPDPGRSPEGVLDRSYDLDATAGVLQGSVTYRRGTYRLTATLESGREVQARWEVGVGAGRDWNRQMSVLVSPGGGLAVRRLSVQRSG